MDEVQISSTAKLAFLCNPQSYPEGPDRVELIETHMAWVFMAGEFVYKLKKPVCYPYLDFSTLILREFYCREEVRLNRRLAPGIYLGVIPLTSHKGRLSLDREGEVVDWLVRMRRLPRKQMFDNLLLKRQIQNRHLGLLAQVLADFYRSCRPQSMSGETYRKRYQFAIGCNLSELYRSASALPGMEYRHICDRQVEFLERRADWFNARAGAGRVVEAHGDLRPQHVCFVGKHPLVIDCLEFNRDLRVLDSADETAYLALECAWLGHRGAGVEFLRRFERCSGDPIPPPLRIFYMAYRATLRARLLMSRLRELGPTGRSLWQQRAFRYLSLAKQFSHALGG